MTARTNRVTGDEDTTPMRYLLLIYGNPELAPDADDAFAKMLQEYGAYTGWLQEKGMFLGGEALRDVVDATTVQVRDGSRIVTDGPFAETKEHLGGYYLIEAADLDAAIEAAARVPGAKIGKVEIRPIQEMG
jgi:hypothetical protein